MAAEALLAKDRLHVAVVIDRRLRRGDCRAEQDSDDKTMNGCAHGRDCNRRDSIAKMNSRRFLPALLLLFVGSGCAALIYEIVWFQLLQLVIGSSAVSLGVLLGTFMGGMCLGSLLLPRFVSARRAPASASTPCSSSASASIGLLVLFGDAAGRRRLHGVGRIGDRRHPRARRLFAGICLLPPTLLMGATLPAIARWVETDAEGVSWLGFFYGGNIAGAVFGSLLAGFYLLRVHDMAMATFAAVAINVVVAVLGAASSPRRRRYVAPPASDAHRVRPALPARGRSTSRSRSRV